MIDFHISFRSSATFAKLASLSPQGLSLQEGLARLKNHSKLPAGSPDDQLSDWLKVLDSHGVSHAVALAASVEELPVLAEVAQKSEGRLLPIAPFDPTTDDALERVEHLLASTGYRGLVLDPGRDGYLLSDPRFAELFQAIESHDGLVMVRSGMPDLSLERAYGVPAQFDPNAANPLHLLVPASRHPNLQFVVLNFGSGFFRELLLVGAECPNLSVETSTPNDWMKAQNSPLGLVDVLERTLAVFGMERILFGSGTADPRLGWNHKTLTEQREAFGACGLSPEECEQLLGANAQRLLALPVVRRRAVPHPT